MPRNQPNATHEYWGAVWYDGGNLFQCPNDAHPWDFVEYPYHVSVRGSMAMIRARLVRKDRGGSGAVTLERALIREQAVKVLRPQAFEWKWEGEDELHTGYPEVFFVLRQSEWGGSPLTRFFRRKPHPEAIFAKIAEAQDLLWEAIDEVRHLEDLLKVIKSTC